MFASTDLKAIRAQASASRKGSSFARGASAVLASRLGQRKARGVLYSSRASARARAAVEKVWADLIAIEPGDFGATYDRALAVARQLQPAILQAIGGALEQTAKWGWDSAVNAWLASLPTDYWLAVARKRLLQEATAERADDAPGGFGVSFDVDTNASPADIRRQIEELAFPPPTKREVNAILLAQVNGKSWPERVQALSRNVADPAALAQRMATGLAQGKTMREVAKDIEPLVNNVRSSAMRIARTEALRVGEQMAMQTFERCDDIVSGYQLNETMDDVTRPDHAARHGTIFWKDPRRQPTVADMPELPDAPNCRGWMSPVLIGEEAVRTDAGNVAVQDITGLVQDPGTYQQWFAQQPPEIQAASVGAGRYEAMRLKLAGKRPVEWIDFYDPKNEQYISKDRILAETPRQLALRKNAAQKVIDQRNQLTRSVVPPDAPVSRAPQADNVYGGQAKEKPIAGPADAEARIEKFAQRLARFDDRSKDPEWAAIQELARDYVSKNVADDGSPTEHGMSKPEQMMELRFGGVRWLYPKSTDSPETRKKLAQVLIGWMRNPQKLRESTHTILHTTQDNKDDPIWRARYKDFTRSSATGGDGSIVVYGGPNRGILPHEAGHNAAEAIYGSTQPSPGSDFAEAAKKEPPPTKYARNGINEDFAESASLYARRPAELKRLSPSRYAVMEKLFGPSHEQH